MASTPYGPLNRDVWEMIFNCIPWSDQELLLFMRLNRDLRKVVRSIVMKSMTRSTAWKDHIQLQIAFEEETLTQTEWAQLPNCFNKNEYMARALKKRYGKPVPFSCDYCAREALFDEDPSVTDDEIIEVTGLPHK